MVQEFPIIIIIIILQLNNSMSTSHKLFKSCHDTKMTAYMYNGDKEYVMLFRFSDQNCRLIQLPRRDTDRKTFLFL